jgi:hypothetical protein
VDKKQQADLPPSRAVVLLLLQAAGAFRDQFSTAESFSKRTSIGTSVFL